MGFADVCGRLPILSDGETMKPKRQRAIWTTAFPAQAKALRPEIVKVLATSERGEKAELRRRYLKAKRRFLENRMCAVFPNKQATQVHHIRGRLGTLLLNESFWLPVSQDGHRKIHDEPEWARSNEYLCKAGDWNKQ